MVSLKRRKRPAENAVAMNRRRQKELFGDFLEIFARQQ